MAVLVTLRVIITRPSSVGAFFPRGHAGVTAAAALASDSQDSGFEPPGAEAPTLFPEQDGGQSEPAGPVAPKATRLTAHRHPR